MSSDSTYRVDLDSLGKEYLYGSFFSGRKAWHEGEPVKQLGYSGELINQQLAADNYVSIIVIFGIAMTIVMAARSARLFIYQMQHFFRLPRVDSVKLRETSSEALYQMFLCFDIVLAAALFVLSIHTQYDDEDALVTHDFVVAGIVSGALLVYMFVKMLLHFVTHRIFFERSKRYLARVEVLFHTALAGMLLFILVLLHIYFGVSTETTIASGAAVVILLKFVCLCKLYGIFFKKKAAKLRFFLYLCTQELIPLALLAGALIYYANTLTINI